MTGWVCLHRKIRKWEWYSDTNVVRVFLHCLLSANYKTTEWKGVKISKGSFVTGRKKLATATSLTEQQTRTALDKLKSTNEITIVTHNKFSIITIVNWEMYQINNQQNTGEITNNQPAEQPTNNQQNTTDNNINNINNKIKEDDAYAFAGDFFNLKADHFQKFRKFCPSLTDQQFKAELMKFDLAMLHEGQTKKDSKWFFRLGPFLERAEDKQTPKTKQKPSGKNLDDMRKTMMAGAENV